MKSIGTVLATRPLNPRNQEEKTILGPRTPRKTQQQTERIADYLVEKFQSPQYKPLFLKVAWRLDQGTIDRLASVAFELGKNPRAYFIASVKSEKAYYA